MMQKQELPSGWRKQKLADLANVKGGKRLPKGRSLVSENTGYPYIRVTDMHDGGVSLENVLFIPQDIVAKISRYRIFTEDIFITVAGTLGVVGEIPQELNGANLTENADRITDINCDKKFLLQVLRSSFIQGIIKSTQTQNAQPKLAIERINTFPILLPPQPEQKAIAALLSTWDEAIEKTERLIVKKQKFYEAQLSKRLSLDVSERIKLKKFLKEVSKRNRDLSITQVLSVTNSKGFVRPEDQFDRQVASDNLSNYKIVSKGEYAYNPSRINVGSIARLDGWDVGVLSPMYTVFEIKKPSELHTDLFLHWLNSHEAKQRIKLSAQGSVRETVSFDDFCAIGFPKIDFNEQKSLAEFFSLISAEIDTLKALSDKYKTQKRGLMQKMLTGEWRVKSEIVNQYMEA